MSDWQKSRYINTSKFELKPFWYTMRNIASFFCVRFYHFMTCYSYSVLILDRSSKLVCAKLLMLKHMYVCEFCGSLVKIYSIKDIHLLNQKKNIMEWEITKICKNHDGIFAKDWTAYAYRRCCHWWNGDWNFWPSFLHKDARYNALCLQNMR